MAQVTIDIPGVGNVVAKNAASEATLKEILKAFQANGRGASGAGGGGAGGAGVTNQMTKANKENTKQTKETTKEVKESGDAFNRVGRAVGLVSFGMGRLTKIVETAGRGVLGLGERAAQIIQTFANVGDSVESAAGVFSGIPVVGTIFAAVASAATKVTDSFQSATAAGATFGGSITNFSRAASGAGMTMEKFGQMIAQNGEGLRLLGGTTEAGANRFSQISNALRKTSGDLYALGFSTADVNQGIASYSKLMGSVGKLQGMSNADLVKGSKAYLKEIDALAKITGETRKQQEEAQAKLAASAQFQAMVGNMNATEAKKMMATITGLPPGLRSVAEDIMATGTATTEESQQFMALMPKSAAKMAEFAEMSKRGIAPTVAQQQELQNLLKMEGAAAKKQYGDNARYNKDIAKTFMMMNDSANITKDGLVQATAEQEKAIAKTDGMAAQMEKTKQTLAEFSNGFQMALANSGILDLMLKAFTLLAGLVQTFVVPAFNVVAGILTAVLEPALKFLGEIINTYVVPAMQVLVGFFVDTLLPVIQDLATTLKDFFKPIFEEIGAFFRDTLYPAFLDVAVFVRDTFLPTFMDIASAIGEIVTPVFEALGGIIKDYVWPAFQAIGSFIADNLTPIFATLLTALTAYATYQLVTGIGALISFGTALIAATLPFLPLIAAVGAIAAGFFFLYKKLEEAGFGFNMLGDGLRLIKVKFKEFTGAIGDIIAKIPGMGRSEEEEKAREEEKKALEEEKKEIQDRLEQRRKQNAFEATEEGKRLKAIENERKREELKLDIDKKVVGYKQTGAKHIQSASGSLGAGANSAKESADAAKEATAQTKEVDMSSPINSLMTFAEQQKSSLFVEGDKEKKQKARAEERAQLQKTADTAAAESRLVSQSGNQQQAAEATKKAIEAQKQLAAYDKKIAVDAARDELNYAKTDAEKKVAAQKLAVAEKQLADFQKISSEKQAAAKATTPGTGKVNEAEAPKAAKATTPETGKVNEAEAPKAAKATTPGTPATSKLNEAEAPKTELEAQAARKAAEDKAKKEAEGKSTIQDQRKIGPSGPAQESTESLLASLNSKMDVLIGINRRQIDVGERQLSVQASLSGDGFNI